MKPWLVHDGNYSVADKKGNGAKRQREMTYDDADDNVKNRNMKQPQQERVDNVADQVEGSSDNQAPIVTVLRDAEIGRE